MAEFNPFSLSGKTILVVGASSGIGREIAIECSKMGASLIISARREDSLQSCIAEMNDGAHSYIVADITKADDLENMVSLLPVLDGFVISAGKGCTHPLSFASREKFDSIYELNFFATVELARLIYKKKKIRKGGSMVFISSIAGEHRITPGNGVYGTAKSALNAYARYAAIEYAARGIRVNTINPGIVNTKLINASGKLTDEDYRKDMESYPLKRYGEVTDIAPAAVYLLSDASSWMTGQAIVIDGGVSV